MILLLPSSSCGHIRTFYILKCKTTFSVNVSGSECHGTNLTTKKTYPFVRYLGAEMKKVPFFSTFQSPCMELEIPPPPPPPPFSPCF